MTGGHLLNLSSKELDRHVYRIMPQEYAFSLFSERQNVLSRVHNWKDKFENFQLKVGGTLEGERFDYSFRDAFVGQNRMSSSASGGTSPLCSAPQIELRS